MEHRERGAPSVGRHSASMASAAIMVGSGWKSDSCAWVGALGLFAGVLTGIVIMVVAFLFGAGLHCTDRSLVSLGALL